MRKEHEIEASFNAWKTAGYGTQKLHEIQLQEIRRAFMGGVFEGLNFIINQMDKSPETINETASDLYKFLKQFHYNEIVVNKKSPYGKRFF